MGIQIDIYKYIMISFLDRNKNAIPGLVVAPAPSAPRP